MIQLWETSDWELCHDNTPAHVSHLMQFFGETLNHPGDSALYNPDLMLCNFWLFPKLKLTLKGNRFQIIDEIQEITMEQLMGIGRTV